MTSFNHFNFNVLNLERSLAFYKQAFDLAPVRSKEKPNYTLVWLGDGHTDFTLELTYLHDRTEAYNLGECEYHLAFMTDEYDALLAKHKAMGCVALENTELGIYFVTDPDGYWIEIVPKRD